MTHHTKIVPMILICAFAITLHVQGCGGGGGGEDFAKTDSLSPNTDVDGDDINDADEAAIGSDSSVSDVLFVSNLSPNASDQNSGSKSLPLATLPAAFNKANATASAFNNPITVLMTSGEFKLDGTMTMKKVRGIIGGYNADFSSNTDKTTILFAPAVQSDEHVIFHVNVEDSVFRNLQIVPERGRMGVRAIFLQDISTDSIEITDNTIIGHITLDSMIDHVTIKNNFITGTDGKIEHTFSGTGKASFLNPGLFIADAKELTVAGNTIYGGVPSDDDKDVYRYGIFLLGNMNMPEGETSIINISDNEISCGTISIHRCEVLNIGIDEAELTISNNKIIGAQTVPLDDDLRRDVYGLLVDGDERGKVVINDNQIDLYGGYSVTGVSVEGGSRTGELIYEIYRNHINIYATDQGMQDFVAIEGAGAIGAAVITDNVISLPKGGKDIVFPETPTTLANNSVTYH